jgi:hypothetical protein
MEPLEIDVTIPLESGFTHVLFNLAAQGIGLITVSYSGGGDNGAIDEIVGYRIGDFEEPEDLQDEPPKLKGEDITFSEEVEKLIEHEAYDQILENASDWVNNDGGGGTLYIYTASGDYYCDHYYYVTATEEDSFSGKMKD